MSKPRTYLIKDAARLSGVSVRTLHHYDRLGLLTPSGRTAAGYRVYTEANLLRLQQILIGRALGLSLEEIRRGLDDPGFDQVAALRRQRELLAARVQETQAMLRSIDAALTHLLAKDDVAMDEKSLFEGFDPALHEAEAKARWGQTEAYQESARRAATYSKADWAAMQAEADALWKDAATLMAGGEAPNGEAAGGFVERHRLHVERWFYPCPPAMQVKLAELWEGDSRFSQSIDRFGEGLTAWAAAAIRAQPG